MAALHDQVALRLRILEQRYTRNRREVVDLLSDSAGPITIDELLEKSDLAQSSTYRNLTVLEEAGVVHRIITTDDHARFELTEELTGHHHHHLVCSRCGLITDVTLPTAVEASIDAALTSAAAGHAFQADHHRVDLVGRCRSCR